MDAPTRTGGDFNHSVLCLQRIEEQALFPWVIVATLNGIFHIRAGIRDSAHHMQGETVTSDWFAECGVIGIPAAAAHRATFIIRDTPPI